MQGQGGLDEADHAGRTLQVAHVRLGRTDGEGDRPVGPGAERRAQCRRLDRVADRCAGAVQFDVLHRVGADPRGGERRVDDLVLRFGVGDRQALARAVVVDGGAADDAVHAVAVGQGPGEGLEDDEGAALTADETVGAGVEGEAAGVGGQAAEAFDGDGALGDEIEVDAAREDEVRLAAAQALGCQMDCDQRRGLAAVHRHARPPQPQRVGEPVGDDASLGAGEHVPGDALWAATAQQGRVVVGDRADIDACGGASDGVGGDSGVLQCFPAQFEGESLLGVHGQCLARGDTEEGRVEAVDTVEPAAWALVSVRRRVAVRGGFADGVPALAQEFPEGGRIRRARKPARDADHRDRLGCARVRHRDRLGCARVRHRDRLGCARVRRRVRHRDRLVSARARHRVRHRHLCHSGHSSPSRIAFVGHRTARPATGPLSDPARSVHRLRGQAAPCGLTGSRSRPWVTVLSRHFNSAGSTASVRSGKRSRS